MKYRMMTEAAGSPVSSFMIKAIKDAGFISIATDIHSSCAAKILSDEFIVFPPAKDVDCWKKIERLVVEHHVDIVIPSFDETLLGWAERKAELKKSDINVLISPPETIKIFQDKWETALFFERFDLPAAKSSLLPDYPLIKPRAGRGSVGIRIEHDASKRTEIFCDGDISQTILEGQEYTVDCLFDDFGEPIFIVPRKRGAVVAGKSTMGVTVKNKVIDDIVRKIAKEVLFIGPINIQFFVDGSDVKLIEINPRIAGGMALGFAATENWIPLFADILNRKEISACSTNWGLKMFRTYQEVYSLEKISHP